ncbi:MAG: hypothetical protein J0I34_25610 [Pseudonocardia sp.]|uniref:hypothetical protein n=1 Tax=unclassified Pseudonocardia TaxID=2619320 RepID=UPI00086F4B5B|nr:MULTISPECIES: hypothetical protein [unclassified Pseudonocardia]MBN9112150.1 hypothetical protein [Pseudonocardia sp.]ODU26073.1 MAG: hypothetical protein ABS80_08120 [Pseudonocardia sp. SCN 72-51]ODU99867.1 MAG: hypothetical protein ABT15_30810 [Pseudonocardia sp. SCN 73-27]
MNATPQQPRTDAAVAEARAIIELCIQGSEANDRDDLIRKLTTARTALARHPGPATVRDAASECIRALESLKIDLRTRRTTLADPGRAARLRAELDRARNHFEDFQTRSREWPQLLGEGFSAMSSDAEFALRTRARQVIAEAEESIEANDPKKNSEAFDAWLRHRLAVEADDVYSLLLERSRRVAAQLGEQLDAPPPRVESVPVTAPDRLVAELQARPASSGGNPPAGTRMIGILMPTYGGIMMAIVLSRFLGLNMPGWVIAVCAVVGAAGLGGAALSGERKRQLDRRRGDAKSTLRGMIDEYQLAMSKQIRDATRLLQGDLRKAATTVVNTRASEFTDQLDAAREAADTARNASADLSDISDDLESVAELQARARRLIDSPPEGRGERILKTVS